MIHLTVYPVSFETQSFQPSLELTLLQMTAPGAEGIVSNSPLTSWQFRLFGPYVGSDLVGLTEITAAVLFIAGYLSP